jgi:hypothetical protein
METNNIYFNLKKGIETHFGFLKDFGFSDFVEKEIDLKINK